MFIKTLFSGFLQISPFLVSTLLLLVVLGAATFPSSKWDEEILQLLNFTMVIFPTLLFLAWQFHLMELITPFTRNSFFIWLFWFSSNHTDHYLSRPFAGFSSSLQVLIVAAGLIVLLPVCTHSFGNLITFYGFKYSKGFYIYTFNLSSTLLHAFQIPKSYIQTLTQHFHH